MTVVGEVSLKSYVIRRVLQAVPLVFGVILVCFVIIQLAPGNPLYLLGGEYGTQEYMKELAEKYGLDKPLLERLTIYLWNVIHGDLGYSVVRRQPVIEAILERVPITLLLMGTQLVIATTVGVWAGIVASLRPFSKTDNLVTSFSLIGNSFPIFWLGQMIVLVFAVNLHWFPVQGIESRDVHGDLQRVLDLLHHLALPAMTLAITHLTIFARLARSSMFEALGQNYIVTAFAKGLRNKSIYYKHALRNALLPIVTVVGMNVGIMLTGTVLTETVFAWPGVGRLFYTALVARDYPIVMGILIMVSLAVIISNLVTDIMYCYLDPRIKYR